MLLLIATLATWQTVEVIHHGSIFASFRAYIEVCNNNFIRKLFSCPFCLSVWVGTFWAIVLGLADYWFMQPLVYFGYGLAVSRLANLCNDIFYDFSRMHNEV